jgi:hypothetical protein
MKNYPLRSDIETVDICECGHIDTEHELFSLIKLMLSKGTIYGGKCGICTCPKFKLEKTMLKKEYMDKKNTRSMST